MNHFNPAAPVSSWQLDHLKLTQTSKSASMWKRNWMVKQEKGCEKEQPNKVKKQEQEKRIYRLPTLTNSVCVL